MTVKYLIDELKKQDQDKKVHVASNFYFNDNKGVITLPIKELVVLLQAEQKQNESVSVDTTLW